MKIVVLTGSPRRNGNSNYLADRFIEGAEEQGHEVYRFDCARHRVSPCIACNHCQMDGDCVFNDDFTEVKGKLVAADVVVFASPLYYFGLSAQIKAVIDRFYSINGKLQGAAKRTVLLLSCADTGEEAVAPVVATYRQTAKYLGWTDCGMVLAEGLFEAGEVRKTGYGEEAYRLGCSLV